MVGIFTRFGSWKKALLAARTLADTGKIPASAIPRPRGPISYQTRFLVFRSDAYSCRICKDSGVKLELDHIVPHSRADRTRWIISRPCVFRVIAASPTVWNRGTCSPGTGPFLAGVRAQENPGAAFPADPRPGPMPGPRPALGLCTWISPPLTAGVLT